MLLPFLLKFSTIFLFCQMNTSYSQTMDVQIDGTNVGQASSANNPNFNLFQVNYGTATSLTFSFTINGAVPQSGLSVVRINNIPTVYNAPVVVFFGTGFATGIIFRSGGAGNIQIEPGQNFQIHYDENGDGVVNGNDIEIITSVLLPVELLFFDATLDANTVLLNWQTASELNNEKFEVEQSRDGRDFQKIGEIEGKGTTLEQQDYSYEVKNPRNGISYYRLKQIDFDGQFEYSKVISVNFKGENGDVGEFYPNPSKSGLVNIYYTSQTDDEIAVSVFDVTGKLVVNQIQQVSNGDNNLSFDFSELNTGTYIVKIGDERNPTHRKLIIER